MSINPATWPRASPLNNCLPRQAYGDYASSAGNIAFSAAEPSQGWRCPVCNGHLPWVGLAVEGVLIAKRPLTPETKGSPEARRNYRRGNTDSSLHWSLLTAPIDVFEAHDVVFAQVGATLYLDQLDRDLARV